MNVLLLHPKATAEHLGFLPQMLNENDTRPAREQFDTNYRHGGGWQPIPGMTMHNTTLRYPGDPPFKPIAMILLRDEMILLYEHDLVCILQRDGTFEVARMD